MKRKVLIIVGPTASGKSDLAVQIATKNNGEIISADSRQVYKDLDIGSGKISKDEMKGINHYGLDIVNVMGKFTANDWLLYTNKKIEEIIAKNKLPIIVGGTGMYIDALLYGIDKKPGPDYSLRLSLQDKSLEDLQNIIKKRCEESGSDYFAKLNNSEKNNKERLIRKLETLNFEIERHKQKKICTNKITNNEREVSKDYEFEFIILEKSKEELKSRIKLRLEKRLELNIEEVNPLINEIENIIEKYNNRDEIKTWLKKLGLEYKYITMYLSNEIDYEDMKSKLEIEIFKYAKRQNTWNKKYVTFNRYEY